MIPLQTSPFHQLTAILFKIIPENILKSASESQILGLIPFCLLFGYFTSKISSQTAHVLFTFCQGVFDVMMLMTKWIMKALPLGVFMLIGHVVATAKPELFRSLAYFALTVLVALGVYSLVILPSLLKLGGVSPVRFYKAMTPALFTAFTTSSSAATLPVTLECAEREANIPNSICSFVSLWELQSISPFCVYISVYRYF